MRRKRGDERTVGRTEEEGKVRGRGNESAGVLRTEKGRYHCVGERKGLGHR